MKVKEYLKMLDAIREILEGQDQESEVMFIDDTQDIDINTEVNKATMN